MIAEERSSEALDELLSTRKLFEYGGVLYRFDAFAKRQFDHQFPSIGKFDDESDLVAKLDLTYNLLIAKFSELKNPDDSKQKGPFCDSQYKRLNNTLPTLGEDYLGSETQVADAISRMVKIQINYAWLDACRKLDPDFTRYRWQTPDGEISLIRPRWINVRVFREWLVTTFPDYSVLDSDEIKARIRAHYGKTSSLVEPVDPSQDPIEDDQEAYISKRLYRDVGIEKASNLEKQRPSIRGLGEKNVYNLCIELLEGVFEEGFSFTELSNRHGISKTNLSRFAGLEWISPDSNSAVPDLWKNLARVVLTDEIFLDAATEWGILPQLKRAVEKRPSKAK